MLLNPDTASTRRVVADPDIETQPLTATHAEETPVAAAHPVVALNSIRIAQSVLSGALVSGVLTPNPNPQPSLPLASSQNGNLFSDRFDGNLFWYLPGYALAGDPDAGFAFAATQNGSVQTSATDSTVTPFNTARLTLSLKKFVPPDVQAAQAQNAAARFQEIPFTNLVIALTVPYKLPDGTDQQSVLAGETAAQADGTLAVTFDSIVGTTVVLIYENLMQTGGASVGLLLSYAVWRRVVLPPPPVPPPPRPGPPHPVLFLQRDLTATTTADSVFLPRLIDALQFSYVQALATEALVLPLSVKYADGRYRQLYTLMAGAVTRPILDVTDLTQFSVPRSEFTEFEALGDISAKYPSLRQLYLGQVSRTIVAIPAAYGIVRGSGGCAALCQALVDSSTQSASGSRFHFSFTVAPVVSAIDLVQLSQDLAAVPSVKDCALTLPTGLDARIPVSFADPFVSAPAVAGGVSSPHSFLFSLDIADGAEGAMPAAAGVNLFLRELGAPLGTPLFGHFGIRLDDDYDPPVQADLILNLHATSASDDMEVNLTADTPPALLIANNAPFDLALSRYAAAGNQGLAATLLAQTLAAGQSLTLPLPPGDYSGVYVDAALALAPQVANADLIRYLVFQTQDVQEVKSWLGINATGVDFAGLGITQIDIVIAFTGLPGLAIPPLTVTPLHLLDNTQVLVPLDSAVTSLAATLSVTVQGGDPARVAPQVTLANDFSVNPVFVLTGTALAPTGP